ncbi:MAG: hypothetical protein KKC55_14660 [Gammaproteobacteria bacterium]|nr:hypothetical protein [Gammaproteobacteria bacterium]
MIFCFGNSHVSIFSGTDKMVPIWPERSVDTLPWFRTFRLGACTAYQAMKWIKEIITITKQGSIGFNREKDTLLLVFGEVDIRAHVALQAEKQNKFISTVTLEIVDRYCEAISLLKSEGFNVAVFGCVAGFVLKDGDTRPPWPYFGTIEQRNGATKIFNDSVGDFCKKIGVPFISVFEEMLEDDGITTKIRYLDMDIGKCHINNRMLAIVLWKFRDIGLIPWEDIIAPYEVGECRF